MAMSDENSPQYGSHSSILSGKNAFGLCPPILQSITDEKVCAATLKLVANPWVYSISCSANRRPGPPNHGPEVPERTHWLRDCGSASNWTRGFTSWSGDLEYNWDPVDYLRVNGIWRGCAYHYCVKGERFEGMGTDSLNWLQWCSICGALCAAQTNFTQTDKHTNKQSRGHFTST